MLTDDKTRGPFFHDKHADSLVAGDLQVGFGGHTDHLGHVCMGNENFSAVEDIMIPVPEGLGGQPGHIGSGIRFRQAKGRKVFPRG